MPRTRRRYHESGFYHVVTKGNGGRIIFESDRDRRRYLSILADALAESSMRLHAYCLMSNHTHLLLEEGEGLELSEFMKIVNENYARYFAWRTGHVGHVYQARFWSEGIDDERRLLGTVRYIHANPEVAGICSAEDYEWSSFGAYVRQGAATGAGAAIVATRFVLELTGGIQGFRDLSASGASHALPFAGSKLTGHLDDDELLRVVRRVVGPDALMRLSVMAPSDRVSHVRALREAGLSGGQIARLTGLGRGTVYGLLNMQIEHRGQASVSPKPVPDVQLGATTVRAAAKATA